MSLRPGLKGYVTYGADDPGVWHERYLIAEAVGPRWLIASPDGDVYVEDLRALEFIAQPRPGVVPPALAGELVYGFVQAGLRHDAAWWADEMESGLITAQLDRDGPPRNPNADKEAREMIARVRAGGLEAGFVPLAPPGAGAGPARPAGGRAGPLDAAAPALGPNYSAPAGWMWVAAEEDPQGQFLIGSEIVMGAAPDHSMVTCSGRRGVARHRLGMELLVVLIESSASSGFPVTWRGADARVLPVVRTSGKRARLWRDATEAMSEEAFEDFPLAKPRTTRWCCQHIAKIGEPNLHHDLWKQKKRLQETDFGVHLHGLLARAVTLFATYDQYDLSNSAGMEWLFRQMQLVEHFWEEKRSSDLDLGRLSPEEVVAFGGEGRSTAMVCPDLLDTVSKELERISNVKKNSRKLREEQEATKKKGGPGGGGGGGTAPARS